MRMMLALMLFSPIVISLAMKFGVDRITPILILMSLFAIVGQVALERRASRD